MIFIIIIATLMASAFFSGIEIAFISANRLKIELDKKQGSVSGKILSYFIKNQEKFISTLLLGNNLALVGYGIYMAIALEPSISNIISNLILDDEQLVENCGSCEALILLTQTILSTLLVLITAEFIPKAIFRINPNRTLNLFGPLLVLIYILLFIPTFITSSLSRLFLKAFNVDISSSEQAFTKIDLDDYVRDINDRMDDKADMESEMQILQNALDFDTIKVRDCMIPRTEILAFDIEDSIIDLKDKFIETGYSKILIFRDNIDNIIGYVHSFELFKKPEEIKQILLPISIVSEASLVEELLTQFSTQKRSIAVVVDEFGGTSGLITVEDIIEEIFGEIEDEHDAEDLIEKELSEGEYLFSARHEIDYINEKYKLSIDESDEYTTLGGFVVGQLEDIPQKGDSFFHKDYKIEITGVSDTKVEEVLIKEIQS